MAIHRPVSISAGSADVSGTPPVSIEIGPAEGLVRKRAVRHILASEAGASGSDLQKRIERARQMFISRTHAKIERSVEIVSLPEMQSSWHLEPEVEELRKIAHSLSGTAVSFGYARLSDVAERLKMRLSSTHSRYQDIADLVMEMAVIFINDIAGKPVDRPTSRSPEF